MTHKIADLAVKTGEYQKDGQMKGRYENVGSLMEGDNGRFLILKRTFNPAGVPNPDDKDSVIVSCFEQQGNGQQAPQRQAPQQQQQPQNLQQYNQQQPQAPQQNNGYPNDIPFG